MTSYVLNNGNTVACETYAFNGGFHVTSNAKEFIAVTFTSRGAPSVGGF
jgi:hypothetical protein